MTPESDETFQRLLGHLHALLDQEVAVALDIDDHFFGIGFTAQLERVETLPSSSAVILYFANGVTVDVAPAEQDLVVDGHRLELRLSAGLALRLTPAGAAAEESSEHP